MIVDKLVNAQSTVWAMQTTMEVAIIGATEKTDFSCLNCQVMVFEMANIYSRAWHNHAGSNSSIVSNTEAMGVKQALMA